MQDRNNGMKWKNRALFRLVQKVHKYVQKCKVKLKSTREARQNKGTKRNRGYTSGNMNRHLDKAGEERQATNTLRADSKGGQTARR